MSPAEELLSLPPSQDVAAWLRRVIHYHPRHSRMPALFTYMRDLLDAVVAHTPAVVASPVLEAPVAGPMGLSLEGTVMFADIDGFTPLAERFSQVASRKSGAGAGASPSGAASPGASQEGAEELTELVNRFLAILIHTTSRYDGDLLKFGGDAGLLYFHGEEHALRAIAAALDVQREMAAQLGEVETSWGRFPLRLAIGLGSGRMVGLGLGDHLGRELLPLGEPLATMGRAQELAPPGEIVIHQSTLSASAGRVTVTALGVDMYLVQGMSQSPSPLLRPVTQRPPQLQPVELLAWHLSRLDALAPYLAPGLLERLIEAPALDRGRLWSDLRQVTIMMLTLPELGDLLPLWGDTERLQQALQAPNQTFIQVRDVIRRYDGVLNKIAIGPHGAYLLVLFGAPQAHEDDPLRAVLAALELQELFGHSLHFGINTGFVFAGDVGTAERREYTVMGDEVNFAARLMSKAGAGEIWLGPRTARHPAVARRVLGDFAPATTFKGKARPLAPFIVAGLRPTFMGEAADVALVGREKELQQLRELLQGVEAQSPSAPSAVLLHGNAGVGKSRLAQELAQIAQAAGFAVHTGTVPSYGEHLPFAGWDSVLSSLFALENENTPAQRAQALSAALERVGVGTWAALVAPLLGLTVAPSNDVLSLPPTMRDMQRQAALLSAVEGAAREQPRVLIFDNVQWMSSASLEMLGVLLESPPPEPLLVVIICREVCAQHERWLQLPHVLDLPVGPLAAEAMRKLVQRLFEDVPLPEQVTRWVAARSSGLPIFATEAVRTLIGSGMLQRREDSWELSGSLEDFPLPDMVYALIQSRIDQLSPPDRHLLRAAATVGDEMTFPTLVAAYGEESEDAVRRRLPQLAPFGLLPRDYEGQALIFRQPLVREVAYRGLPHRVQRQIHRRLAEYLDFHRERAAPNWLTLLAHHAFEAQLWERAMETNLGVGRQAVAGYLADQARQALLRTLEAADAGGIPDVAARFEARYLLGETLTSLGDYEEALEHLGAARQLVPASPQSLVEVAQVAKLDYREAAALEAQGHYGRALTVVEHGLELEQVEQVLEGARLYLMGADLHRRLKDYAQARAWGGKALSLCSRFVDEEGRQVRSRAMYMIALLASLERFQHP